MTTDKQIEGLLAAWFDESAPPVAPSALLDEVKELVAVTPRRPAWAVLGWPGGVVRALVLVAALVALAGMTAWAIAGVAPRPDASSLVAYAGYSDGVAKSAAVRQILVAAPDGSAARALTSSPWWKSFPSWSPDGRLVAFVAEDNESLGARPGGRAYLGVVDVATRVERRIADLNPGKLLDTVTIAWSPDASMVAVSDIDQTQIVDVMTSEIVYTRQRAYGALWLPDGGMAMLTGQSLDLRAPDGMVKHLVDRGAFWPLSLTAGGDIVVNIAGGIEVIAPNGDERKLLVDDGSWAVASPDGSHIAYLRTTDGSLWVMDPDGGGQRRLVSGEHRPSSLQWSPDGTQIAYRRRIAYNPSVGFVTVRLDGTPGNALALPGAEPGLRFTWTLDGRTSP